MKGKTWIATAILLACTLLVALPVSAQENYGSITGTVTDATGGAVPGAVIELVSPELPRGIRATTEASGAYAMPRVPNGIYTLTISKEGFSKFVQRNVEVRLGTGLTYNAQLKIGAVAEVVEVTESVVQLDTTSSTTATNITRETFDNLPKGRNFHSLLTFAPGVRFEPKAGNAGVGGFQTDGASGSENLFLIDGADISDIRRGSLRVQNSIPFEFLSEIQIKSSGFGAEFGGATGGVMNAQTRSGSNAFHGMALYNITSTGLNPRPHAYWKRSVASADVAQYFHPLEDQYKIHYPGFMVGGPIAKNTLFFNVAWMPQLERRSATVPYASGARTFTRDDTVHYGLARLDFNPTSKLQFNSSWIWSPWKRTGTLPNRDPLVAAPANNLAVQGGFQPAQQVNFNGTYALTSRWFVTGRMGYKYQNDKGTNYGLSGAPYLIYRTSSAALPEALRGNVPAELRQGNGFSNVSSTFGILKDVTDRYTVNADSNYIANLGGKQHIFKFGYAMARVGNNVEDDYTNGQFDIYWNDAFTRGSVKDARGTYGYYIWQDGVRHKSAVNSRNLGLYVQDDFKVTQRFTLNLGVRLENEFLPPYTQEVRGVKVANPVSFGWGDKIAPRIGFAWSPDAGAKWKIAGSFGLYYDVMKYELARGSFGGDYWFSNVFTLENPALLSLGKANPGAAGRPIISYDNRNTPINAQGELEGIDPNLKPYTSREFTGTVSREIKPGLIFTARYTRKDLLKAIEDIGVLDADDNEVYLIGNPGFGETRNEKSDYGHKTPNGQEFQVPKAVRQYNGLEFRIDGRWRRNIMASTSYTYSRLYGNYSGTANSDESGRSDPGVSRAYDLPFYYFDATGSQKNVLGRLGTDRPHTFKAFVNYDMKTKAGVTNFGLSQFAYSGTPDTTTIIYLSAPTSPFGRGDMGRTPVFTQTDLSVQHSIPVGERVKIRLEANFLNLFNQATVVARTTQINRASAFAIDPADFFKGYDVNRYLSPPAGAGRIPRNPIYGLPGGEYRNGGEGALVAPGISCCGGGGYQMPREIRLGLRLLF